MNLRKIYGLELKKYVLSEARVVCGWVQKTTLRINDGSVAKIG